MLRRGSFGAGCVSHLRAMLAATFAAWLFAGTVDPAAAYRYYPDSSLTV